MKLCAKKRMFFAHLVINYTRNYVVHQFPSMLKNPHALSKHQVHPPLQNTPLHQLNAFCTYRSLGLYLLLRCF